MDSESLPPAIDVFALAERDAFAQGSGIRLLEVGLGRAVARVEVGPQHVNFNGVAHGGLTFTLADFAFGCACNSQGILSGGIDVHVVYSLAAQVGDVLTATAEEIARSNRLSTYRIDIRRGDGRLVAAMTGTAYISGKPQTV